MRAALEKCQLEGQLQNGPFLIILCTALEQVQGLPVYPNTSQFSKLHERCPREEMTIREQLHTRPFLLLLPIAVDQARGLPVYHTT